MTNWTKEIEQNLFKNKPTKTPQKLQIVKQPKSNDDGSLNLLFVFLLLCVMLTGAYHYKVNFTTKSAPQPIVIEQPYEGNLVEIARKLDDLNSLTNKVWDHSRRNADKLAIAGTILNHNTAVDQKNLPRTNYIYINNDWTINRLPDQLLLTPEDKAFLQKFVK